MLVVLCIILSIAGSSVSNGNFSTIELIRKGPYYYVHGGLNFIAQKDFLLDTNTPNLLSLETKSTEKAKRFSFISDMSSTSFLLRESWRRTILIYNKRRNQTLSIPLVEVIPYTVGSTTGDNIVPHIIDWQKDSDGIFGIGTAIRTNFRSTFFDGLKVSSYAFLLDGPDPHIDIDQFDEKYESSIIWANKMTSLSRIYSTFYFNLYSFSICDIPLLGTFSTSYPVTLNPSSRCLTVPRQVFNNILGWIPLQCPTSGTGGKDSLCYLSPTWKSKEYPTFEFKINGEHKFIYLSLEKLLIPIGDRQYVCLLNGTDVDQGIHHPLDKQGFIFGNMVLKEFYVAINTTEGRVGLAPLHEQKRSDHNCLIRKRCLPGQTYHLTSNSCKEPNCDAYYFMTLNESKHECRTHPLAIILFWAIVAYYVFCEFNQFYQTNRNRQLLLHNYIQ